jgi:hypothetical protein
LRLKLTADNVHHVNINWHDITLPRSTCRMQLYREGTVFLKECIGPDQC